MEEGQDKFWKELREILEKDAKLRDVDPRVFYSFVEALISRELTSV